jgi:hypothetical protein
VREEAPLHCVHVKARAFDSYAGVPRYGREDRNGDHELHFCGKSGREEKKQTNRYQGKNNELQSLVSPFLLINHVTTSPRLQVGSKATVPVCMLQHWQPHIFAIHHSYVSRSNR